MLSSLNFGFNMAYSLPGAQGLSDEYEAAFPHIRKALSYFTTGSLASAIIGPVITCVAMRFVGRRILTFVFAILSTIFWLIFLAVSGAHIWLAIALRCILGAITGAGSCLNPVYMVELSLVNSTGFFGSLNQVGISAGFVLCYTCAPALQWRGLAILAAAINFLLVLLVWLVPESPALSEEKLSVPELKPNLLTATWLFWLFACVMAMVFQQTSGINAIIMNLTFLFTRKSGQSDMDANLASALASVAQVISGIIGSFLIERWGNRLIWVLSLALITLTDLAYAVILSRLGDSAPMWLCLVIIFLFLFGYGLGVGPIPWFLVPQTFPPSSVAVPMAVVSCTNWVLAFLIVQFRDEVIFDKDSHVNWPVFLVFGLASFVGTIFGFFFVKGREWVPQPPWPAPWGGELTST
jgi:MFS family permease